LNAWEEWARDASPDLLAAFDGATHGVMAEARRKYGQVVPGTQDYLNCKSDMIEALNNLAEAIQGAHDAQY